jgi:diguanylate cyclase (GGDEF)-like protein
MEAARGIQQDALLTRCDNEPIHVPGAVQGHGGLVAFSQDGGLVVYRSGNVAALLELEREPLGASAAEVLGAQATEQLSGAADVSAVDPMPVRLVLPSGQALDATAHRSDGLVVVELEQAASAEAQSALLHELRRSVGRVEAAQDVGEAYTAAVEEVRRLTGYDRVMVYRFHEDEHGEVVAEACRDDLEPYLGLHYPASDIPRPARRLLRLSPTRLIGDVDGSPVPVAGHGAFARRPLDLSRSALRAVSPIHLQYLRNMGVAASLTISLADGPRLWGLLACHHGEPRVPSPELRCACAIVARTFWLKRDAQERFDGFEQHQRRLSVRADFLATVSGISSLAEALVEDGHSLLDLVGADGVCLRIDDVSTSLGATPSREACEELVNHLREGQDTSPVVTDEAGEVLPELGLDPATAAGILALPVAPGWEEYVIWFRGEEERTLTWAGDPAKPLQEDASDPGNLTPRSSFAAWRDTMRGHASAWTRSDFSAATELGAALPAVRAARARDALAKLALRDGLTGLPNRALLLDRLEVALAELQRGGGGIWIMFVDLDGFKLVNDTLGHEAGDQLLVEVAARLRRGVRASDTVARLGGDEFVILCSDTASVAVIDRIAAEVLSALAKPILVRGQVCAVTASIGITPVEKTATPAAVLRAADAAMYRAKRLGRNRTAR